MLLDAIPLPVLVLLLFVLGIGYLVLKYPDRLVGTHPAPPGVPDAIGGVPLLGGAWKMVFRPKEMQGVEMLDMFLWAQRDRPMQKGDEGKREWPLTDTFPPFGRSYMLNRPEYIQYIQKDHFTNFPKGKLFREFFADVLGHTGIFVADGEVWKTQRKLASHIFSVGNFKSHVQTVIHSELDVLDSLFASVSKSGAYVNLQDINHRFTLASFGFIGFNHGFNTLPDSIEGLQFQSAFATAFDGAQAIVDKRLETPGWKIAERFSGAAAKMRQYANTIHSEAYAVVDERLAARKAGTQKRNLLVDDDAKVDRDLLDLFMDHTLDRRVLMELILSFVIAGRDTTAQALSWQMWQLLTHPDILERCREEVASVLGKGEAQRKANYEDISKLPYLNAVFHETLRLHPPVPKNMKFVQEDDVLPAIPRLGIPPIPIRKGEMVYWSDWVIARLRSEWGDDCDEFKPERFLDAEGRLVKMNAFRFHAFNAGPRLCLGQTLATFEALAVTAEMVGRWDFRLAPDTEEPHFGASLTLPIRNPYKVAVSPRTGL